MDVRREEVRRTWPADAEPPPVPPLLTVPASGAWLVSPADLLTNQPHPKCATHQVLLTLYATVAERYAGDDAGGEEEAAEGGTAQPAGTGAPTAAELEAATAFSTSLAALAAQEEAAGQGGSTISQLAALAAQHAAVLQAMHETAQLAASVRVAAELQQRLADFDAAYAAGSYSEAAWIAVELQKGVAAVPGAQGLSMRRAFTNWRHMAKPAGQLLACARLQPVQDAIFGAQRRCCEIPLLNVFACPAGSEETAAAVAARAEPLQQQLLAGVYSCWGIDPATRLPTLAASPPAEGVASEQQQQQGDTSAAAAMLAEIWKALAVFGLLPQALGQLAAHFMEHSVAPILASGGLIGHGPHRLRRAVPSCASHASLAGRHAARQAAAPASHRLP